MRKFDLATLSDNHSETFFLVHLVVVYSFYVNLPRGCHGLLLPVVTTSF